MGAVDPVRVDRTLDLEALGDATFRRAFEAAAAGMSLVGADLRYKWVNRPLCVMLGRDHAELLDLAVTDTVHPEHVERAMAFYERLHGDDTAPIRDRILFSRPDGSLLWAELGGSVVSTVPPPPLYLVQQFDVTAEQDIADELARQAMHDDLTGLANRTLLRDRLQALLARGDRGGPPAVAFYLDIDRFKTVNDRYGHTAGDIVLVETARRLSAVVRAGDTVARVGGDEFVVAGQATGIAEASQMAERIGTALRPPIDVDGHWFLTTVSIGVALSNPLDTPDRLVARADQALLRAKRLPRPHVVVASEA